jgi:hypothetical protein
MNLKRSLSVIGLALLFVPLVALACSLPFASAPSPTETPTAVPLPTAMNQAAAPSDTACLIGAWDVGDLGPYLKAAIPPDALQGGQLEPKGYSGSLIYHFAPDGKVTAVADQYQLNAQVKLAILSLPLKVTINGTTSASYTADPQNETLSLFNPDVNSPHRSLWLATRWSSPIKSCPMFGLARAPPPRWCWATPAMLLPSALSSLTQPATVPRCSL